MRIQQNLCVGRQCEDASATAEAQAVHDVPFLQGAHSDAFASDGSRVCPCLRPAHMNAAGVYKQCCAVSEVIAAQLTCTCRRLPSCAAAVRPFAHTGAASPCDTHAHTHMGTKHRNAIYQRLTIMQAQANRPTCQLLQHGCGEHECRYALTTPGVQPKPNACTHPLHTKTVCSARPYVG